MPQQHHGIPAPPETPPAPPGAAVPRQRRPLADGPRPLPGPLLDVLRDGAGPDRDEQRSAVRRVTIAAVRNGWTFPAYAAEMTDPRNKLIVWFLDRDDRRPRNARAVDAKVRREWDSARRWCDDNPAITSKAEARQQIGLWRSQVDSIDWSGRNGVRDRGVYEALLARATELGSLTPQVSLRRLCEDTAYRGFKTVARAIESLAERKLLRVEPSTDPASAATYELLPPPTGTMTQEDDATAGGNLVSSRRSDAALGLVLGPHAAAVCALLSEFPSRAADLAQRARMDRRTAERKLKVLAELGLAERIPNGWIRGEADARLVAAEYDSEAVAAERVLRHELQREGWHAWHAAQRAAAGRSRGRRGHDEDLWRATMRDEEGR